MLFAGSSKFTLIFPMESAGMYARGPVLLFCVGCEAYTDHYYALTNPMPSYVKFVLRICSGILYKQYCNVNRLQ